MVCNCYKPCWFQINEKAPIGGWTLKKNLHIFFSGVLHVVNLWRQKSFSKSVPTQVNLWRLISVLKIWCISFLTLNSWSWLSKKIFWFFSKPKSRKKTQFVLQRYEGKSLQCFNEQNVANYKNQFRMDLKSCVN